MIEYVLFALLISAGGSLPDPFPSATSTPTASRFIRMTAAEIANKIKLHNALQWFLCIGLPPLSLILWWVSFWFFRWAIYLPLDFFREDAWSISFYLAWLCLIPLAIEGVRNVRPLFDMGEYVRSDFYNNFYSQSDTGRALSTQYGDPMGMAYIASQILYAAPRSLMLALDAWKSILPMSDPIAQEAARILAELRSTRKWTPAENYRQSGAALMVLDDLDLIWREVQSGKVVIRYPPGE